MKALISHVREELGLTQRDVAEAVGVDPTYLCRLESLQRLPSDTVRMSLIRLLKLTPEQQLEWDAQRHPLADDGGS